MEEVKNNVMGKRGFPDWIWRVVILVVVILFIIGFYLLLSGDSFLDIFDGDKGGGSDDSDSGSWLDNLRGSNDSDDNVIPAPPALPS